MTHAEYLAQIESVIANGIYKDNWQSLSGHKTPEWYYWDKFGIFIHWGIYSVPAYGNEWYSRAMYDPASPEFTHHIQTYGKQKDFGYKDFIPMFQGEKFSADAWAELFRQAGARFVMPVCEHHDGFAMYATAFNRWNAKEMGPHRDVIREIKAACESRGLTFCASTHRAEHFFFMNMGRAIDSDVQDEKYRDFYGPAYYCPELAGSAMNMTTADTFSVPPTEDWLEDWMVRTCELIDLHRPKLLYFDWWIHNQAFKPYLKKICAYYYNRAEEWGAEVSINYKHEAFPPSVATFDVERGALTGISPVPWQTDTAIGKQSWGYRADNEYKSSRQIICDLVDIVSKNGMMLLNVGPKSDGTITDEETKVLLDMGQWLRVNGEGIYGTQPWKKFGEGSVNNEGGFFMDNDEKAYTEQDFRFTYKDCCLYAFQMRPKGPVIHIRFLAKTGSHDFLVGDVSVLGNSKIESVQRTQQGLTVTLAEAPKSDLPLCLKIQIE